MLHSPVPFPCPDLSPSGADPIPTVAASDLAAVAQDLEARFLPVGEALLALVETVDAVAQGLGEVRGAFSEDGADQAVQDLAQAALRLRNTPVEQERRREGFALLRTKVAGLDGVSGDLDRVLHMLEYYSLNVKIAAGGMPEFVDFADEMRAQLQVGRAQLADFGSIVAHLNGELASMSGVDGRLGEECDRLIPKVPDQLVAAADLLRQLRGQIDRVVAECEAIAIRIKTCVGEALGAIQIGDSARQRIEHVALACELMSAAGDQPETWRRQTESVIAALCIAHIDAIGHDFGSEARRLQAVLTELLPDTRHLLDSARTDRSITDSANLVASIGSGVADSVALTARLDQANAAADTILAAVTGTIAELSGRVERVRDLGIEVGYMSVNANLRCRREAAISKPIAVIAREIKAHSRIIDEMSNGFVAVAEELSQASDRLGQGSTARQGSVQDALGASLVALETAASRASQGLDKVRVDCGGLSQRLEETIAHLGLSLSAVARLDSVRDLLNPLVDPTVSGSVEEPDNPLPGILERLRRAYTMARERQIHAEVLPCGGEQHTPSPSVDDALDDGLF